MIQWHNKSTEQKKQTYKKNKNMNDNVKTQLNNFMEKRSADGIDWMFVGSLFQAQGATTVKVVAQFTVRDFKLPTKLELQADL